MEKGDNSERQRREQEGECEDDIINQESNQNVGNRIREGDSSQNRNNNMMDQMMQYLEQMNKGLEEKLDKVEEKLTEERKEIYGMLKIQKEAYDKLQERIQTIHENMKIRIREFQGGIEKRVEEIEQDVQNNMEQLNLKFKVLYKDTCRICDIYTSELSSADNLKKQKLEATHLKHLQIAEELRALMNSDITVSQEDETVETLTFDLQKTHSIPKLPTGIVYYKRHLNLYNLGIFNSKD
ncbi:unnamed protein product [Psylliodes chrysocephalus]|uniref:Uncharacterized protein n=1 Tax=Psylliodes chrysocephalus TaxID=3402493 RepID=A0A9P0GDK4_9CUCU|nr:unnamed protein product [Psylliodes chrysocephala]